MKPDFRKWSIIDRYIAWQLALGLIVLSSILLGVAWFSQIIRLLPWLVNNNLSVWMFLRMTSLLLPDLISIIMPISLFAVILFVYNRLISDKELVIMEATGMSPKMLARPAIAVASALTLVAFWLTLYLSPIYNAKYRNFAFEAKNDLSALLVKEGEFNQITQGITLYVRNSANNVLSDIFVNITNAGGSARTIIAERGVVTTTKNNILLSLENGSVQEKSKEKYTFGNFDRYMADLGVIATSEARRPNINELGFMELAMARQLGYAKDDAAFGRHLVELHNRLTTPLYNIILALIALCAIFRSPLNNRGGGYGTAAAVAGMVAAQAFFMTSYNLMSKYWRIYPAFYTIVAAAIFALLRAATADRPAKARKPARAKRG